MKPEPIPAHKLTLDDWDRVDKMWSAAEKLLKDMSSLYQIHRSHQECAHPVCGGNALDRILAQRSIDELRTLVRVAINHLEVERLAGELAYEPDLPEDVEEDVPWERYVTGTGQTLRVHAAVRCLGDLGQFCVIHRPAPGPWDEQPGWATHWRSDRGIMERLCPHGIGHPAPENVRDRGAGVHGCDGCCSGRGPVND